MTTTWTDDESIALDAALVAHDGHCLPLRGKSRVLAMQMMAKLTLPEEIIAERLCLTLPTLQRTAQRAKVRLPHHDLRQWSSVTRIALHEWTVVARPKKRGAR